MRTSEVKIFRVIDLGWKWVCKKRLASCRWKLKNILTLNGKQFKLRISDKPHLLPMSSK